MDAAGDDGGLCCSIDTSNLSRYTEFNNSIIRVDQSIIPGLPDDLSLRCLSKISHGYHGVLECVSKSWRDAIRSTYYAHIKATEGWCGNWLFVSTEESNDLWDAYDPDADKWHTLPRMPQDYNYITRCRFSATSSSKKFLVLGGCYVTPDGPLATNEVVMFDPFKKQWSRVASMRTSRTDFACAVIHDIVYVAGGSKSCDAEGLSAAEVYDPFTDKWEDLPPMPFALFECFSISRGGQFHVVGKKETNVEPDTYVIYDPVEKKWQVIEDVSLFKLSRFTMTTMNGHVYTIPDDGSVRTIGSNGRDWCTLGALPAVVVPHHIRPLKPFCFGFVGFQRHLYVAGGLTLKYDSNIHAYSIMKLNSCRRCDPTTSPLEWQDVKPMPRQTGSVLGCYSLEE